MEPKTIIEAVGADRIAEAVGVSRRTVANKARRRFPAAWFPAISKLCEQVGAECPVEAFSFRSAA